MSRILRPASFSQAVAMLAEHGQAARPIAGGTDTLTRLNAGAAPPSLWVDLSAVRQGRDIRVQDGALRIGALVSFQDMAGSAALAAALPALHQAANIMGSLQIRTRGTLGGIGLRPCLERLRRSALLGLSGGSGQDPSPSDVPPAAREAAALASSRSLARSARRSSSRSRSSRSSCLVSPSTMVTRRPISLRASDTSPRARAASSR